MVWCAVMFVWLPKPRVAFEGLVAVVAVARKHCSKFVHAVDYKVLVCQSNTFATP